MKLLVRSVLLGMPGRDALGHDAQPNPPDRQARQAAPRPGPQTAAPLSLRMRCGQAVLGKGPFKAAARHGEGAARSTRRSAARTG